MTPHAPRHRLLTVLIAVLATALLLAASTYGDPGRASAWPTLALVAVAVSIGAVAVMRAWSGPTRPRSAAVRDQPRSGSEAGSEAGPT